MSFYSFEQSPDILTRTYQWMTNSPTSSLPQHTDLSSIFSVVMDRILFLFGEPKWQGRSFDGCEEPLHFEVTETEVELMAFFWHLGDTSTQSKEPVHVHLKRMESSIHYKLCIERLQHHIPSESKQWNDFYLYSKGELRKEWSWSSVCKGQLILP